MEKIAVIGTGAAGFGVLIGLLDSVRNFISNGVNKKSDFEITIYDIGRAVARGSLPENPSTEEVDSFYNQVYKTIRLENSFKFPPPKTHLGKQIPRQPVGKKLSIFKSESFGGLTNYWGSTMLPFTDAEMAGWPIAKEDLYPYYQRIAQAVGLAGKPDGLSQYFVDDFINRPAIKPLEELVKLDEVINNQEVKDNTRFDIISGLNRCGVETREGQSNSCIYCGECMAGCFQGGIFSARQMIKEYLEDPRVGYKQAKVKKVSQQNDSWEVETDDGQKEGGFTKVFLGAGCPASTEIILRSFNIKDSLIMNDNAVYVFPILYFGKKSKKVDTKSYMSLCNLIIGCLPKEAGDNFAQVQVYPNFDYLWRYNLPPVLWQLFKPLIYLFRARVFWGRLFLHSDHSQAYSVKLENDQLVMDKQKSASYAGRLKQMMFSLKQAVNHQGFYIPPIKPILQKVNSHYTSTLPFGNKVLPVSANGEIAPGLYLCDSSVFPASPAINPGFTIMANACRIADQAVD